jgi:hypothetical protein
MPTLEIFDKRNGFLAFDLRDLLNVIEPFAARLDWYVVEFEPAVLATTEEHEQGSPSWVTELWHKSEAGAVEPMSWERLKDLSTHITQTMNGLFVATDSGSPAPSSTLDPNDDRYRLVVQAVDTSFWAVTSYDENVLQALKERFTDVKLLPATKRYF